MATMNDRPDGSPEPSGSPADRRTDRRIATARNIPVVLLAGDRTLGPAVSMRCVNISNGGMRLEGPAPLVRGARAVVELESKRNPRRAVVGIEVVYSHINHRGDCDAGVRFVKLPESTVRENFLDQRGKLRNLALEAAGHHDAD